MPKSSKKSKKTEIPTRSGKEERLFQNILRITEQFISGKNFRPMTEKELVARLSLPEMHNELFKEVLDKLVELNLVDLHEGKYSWVKSKSDLLKGVIRMHPRGFGFVQLDNADLYEQDIFIPKHLTKNAVDGDMVEVTVNEEISEKGPEGKVISILSRGRTHMAGIIRGIDRYDRFMVHVPLLGSQQMVILQHTKEKELNVGDRVVMEVVDWGSKETETICRYSHFLGHISNPACDIPAAVEEFELRSDFPAEVVEEALELGKKVSAKEIKNREDMRDLITVTIDPDTAKDFDDAISLTKEEDGSYNLGVHIADVSSYVKPGTALDAEAKTRCNSTYFPGVCLPMLPGALSENLCSLKPNVNRLTVSVMMRIDKTGSLIDYRIVKSVIKSSKRFTYKEAKKALDGKLKSPHLSMLNLMVELCRLLKQKRYERGSIEFSLPELVVLVDESGKPTGTDYVTYDITHQMIEEFMLKANEIVAWDLTERGKHLTYRVHDVPAEENLRDFSLLAGAFGFKIPDMPSPQDLQRLFEQAGESTYSNYLASSYIRRMRLAAYSAENIGHYGLSLTHYCHFTSPIRRYVDLVVHRILFEHTYDFEHLQQIASECSEQERISAKAENNVLMLKKLRLLQEMYEKDPYRQYEGIITKTKNFGVYFEIIDLLLEGFIHISELGNDYYIYEDETMALRGSRTGGIFSPGSRITVILKEIDFILQDTKWYIVEEEKSKGEGGQRKDGKFSKSHGMAKKGNQAVPACIREERPDYSVVDMTFQELTKNEDSKLKVKGRTIKRKEESSRTKKVKPTKAVKKKEAPKQQTKGKGTAIESPRDIVSRLAKKKKR